MPDLPMTQSDYDGKPQYQRGRSREYQRLYNYKWSRYSKKRLAKHPLCVYCLEKGITTPATCTDHIIPHKGDIKLFWDTKNHASSCKQCNDQKAFKEGAFKNG
jgi:5-methylcytosine-specific restriction protein A